MNILVTAASRHGATDGIADAIADELRAAGFDVERHAPRDVEDASRYGAVVLGSGVYAGRWIGDARRFTERHHAALRSRPVWLFSSGPIGEPLAPLEESTDGTRLFRELGARDHRTFAGRIDSAELGFVERTITRMVKAPNGDFRDWEAVRSWAHEIAGTLRPATVSGR